MIRLSKTATEAPKPFQRAWSGIKDAASQIGSSFKEAGRSLLGKSISGHQEITQNTANHGWLGNKWTKEDGEKFDNEYFNLTSSEKKQYISNHLPVVIHSEARQDLINLLYNKPNPFTSDLYRIIIDYLSRNMSSESLSLINYNLKLFENVFKKYGSKGLELTDSFQLKAIKYFSDRNEDLELLRKNRSWLKSDEMKDEINNLSPEKQSELRSKKRKVATDLPRTALTASEAKKILQAKWGNVDLGNIRIEGKKLDDMTDDELINAVKKLMSEDLFDAR